jgi:hypothetical protein
MERKALVLRKSRKYKGLVAQGLALGVPGLLFLLPALKLLK